MKPPWLLLLLALVPVGAVAIGIALKTRSVYLAQLELQPGEQLVLEAPEGRAEVKTRQYGSFRVDAESVRAEAPSGAPRLVVRARPELDTPALHPIELRLTSPRAEELARALRAP